MESLTRDFKVIMQNTWPVIIFVCLIAIVLRINYLYKAHKKVCIYKELSYLLCLIYVLCLFQIVTSQDVSGTHGINMTFLHELTRYEFGTRLFYRNVVGNIVLFIPLGCFLGHIFKVDKSWLSLILITLISLIIESIQLSIGRAFDVDDVLLNTIGGMLGYVMYRLFKYAFKNTKGDTCDIIFTIFVVLVFIGIITIII